MTRAKRHSGRLAAIDARTRARRIAGLRQRQAFAHQPEARRCARLAWLAQLTGAIDAGFTQAELIDAQAALAVDPHEPQTSLPLSPGGAR